MSRYHYETNCGQYVLHENGKPVGPLLDEVAIAYALDKEDGLHTLHKHGSPEHVNRWANTTSSKLRETGDPFSMQMADEIQVVQGKFDVEDLNAVLGNGHALKNLLAKLNPIQVDGVEVLEAEATRTKPNRSRIGMNDAMDVVDAVDVSVAATASQAPKKMPFRFR
jgi:hypothetical protein